MKTADLIAAYLDAVKRKDATAVDDYFDPDVEYVVNGTSPSCRAILPWMGAYRGREQLKGFLDHMHRNLEVTGFGPRDVIVDGDHAAAFGTFRLHALSTGRTLDIPYAIQVECRDGLITKYHFLENTLDVASAFRSGGEWLMSTDGAKRRVPQSPLTIQSFTASEAGAWSNAYLILGTTTAMLFDVGQIRSEATQLADMIARSGRTLETVMISHAHPDHFMGLDVITDRFPNARVVSTPNVVADIKTDGPWMFKLLQQKLGAEGPARLVIPEPLDTHSLTFEDYRFEVVEFAEGESRHLAALYLPDLSALLAADLVYNGAHLYLQEKHLESWLARLDELESFVLDRVATLYPGHGMPGDRSLIDATRAYLQDFAEALHSGNKETTQAYVLSKYPTYRVKQFLTMFSVPSYFS